MCMLENRKTRATQTRHSFSCLYCVKRDCNEPNSSKGSSRGARLPEGGVSRGSIGREEPPTALSASQGLSPPPQSHHPRDTPPLPQRGEAQAPSNPLSFENISLPHLLPMTPSHCAGPRVPPGCWEGRCRFTSHSVKPITAPLGSMLFVFCYEVDYFKKRYSGRNPSLLSPPKSSMKPYIPLRFKPQYYSNQSLTESQVSSTHVK